MGTLEITGDVAPMIELGAGFHPEVTGAENTIFYSALLGRDIKSVKQDLTKIAEWAGVEDHMDFPVRTFSSGMLARLAFSAATHERSKILLIDEVLSVGDEKFRAKTKQRIREQLKLGSAVVLVSHDLQTVREMATRVLWLEKGRVELIGSTEEVIAAYQKSQE
jgi:ABC-type polysaccharide/polyol phosphate transport system ATPase subunit